MAGPSTTRSTVLPPHSSGVVTRRFRPSARCEALPCDRQTSARRGYAASTCAVRTQLADPDAVLEQASSPCVVGRLGWLSSLWTWSAADVGGVADPGALLAKTQATRSRSVGSGTSAIEVLGQVVGGQFNLFVIELCGSVHAGDESRAVDAAQVAVDEGVTSLGLGIGSLVSPRCHSEKSAQELAEGSRSAAQQRAARPPVAGDDILVCVD